VAQHVNAEQKGCQDGTQQILWANNSYTEVLKNENRERRDKTAVGVTQ
jgi:hypothetical protein